MLEGQGVYQEWRQAVQNKVPAPTWNATLGSIKFVDYERNVLSIGVPSQVQSNQINSRHLPLLEQELRAIVGPQGSIRITIEDGFDSRVTVAPPVSAPLPVATFTPATPTVGRGQSLDSRMTFETFVTGGSNRMAKAAAESAAERPGREYNPLFIYGKSGLGKTHLLHAIGNYVQRHWPEKEGLYVTTETFLNDFIRSVREQSQIALHERYRSVDVLLIDDIQFMIPRGEGFHENVFHTFNTLHGAGKQIVLTSDQSPRDMDKLQERLRSRLLQGLIVEVGQPDLETRIAILQMKAERENVLIPNDVIEYIANRVRDSIRELEGSITMLRAHSQLAEEKITLEFAKSHLGGLGRDQMILKPQHIIDTVAGHFGFSSTELRGPRRIRPLTHARHIAMYLVREMLPQSSYPVIAKEFGDRNHTSIISAVEKIKSGLVSDRELSQVIIGLTDEITNSID